LVLDPHLRALGSICGSHPIRYLFSIGPWTLIKSGPKKKICIMDHICVADLMTITTAVSLDMFTSYLLTILALTYFITGIYWPISHLLFYLVTRHIFQCGVGISNCQPGIRVDNHIHQIIKILSSDIEFCDDQKIKYPVLTCHHGYQKNRPPTQFWNRIVVILKSNAWLLCITTVLNVVENCQIITT
jgi:hypothetical protein